MTGFTFSPPAHRLPTARGGNIGWFFILIWAGVSTDLGRTVALAEENCLNGWDFTVAMTEKKFNEALERVVDKFISDHTLATFEKKKVEVDSPYLKITNVVRLDGLKISELQLIAVEGEEQTGKLKVTFSTGKVFVEKQMSVPGQKVPAIPVSDFSMSDKSIEFKVKVTAYKIVLEDTGNDHYSIKLEIVRGDAIVGALEFDMGMVSYIGDMRQALSEKLRNELHQGKEFDLGSFDLPKRNVNQSSLIKDLFPKVIRFTFVFAPNGKSVLAALGTASDSSTQEGAFTWRTQKLVHDSNSAITISGKKMMSTIVPLVVKDLKLPASSLSVHGCTEIKLKRQINDFKGKSDLKSLSMKQYGTNELETNLNMFNHVSSGITVDIYVTVRLRLVYNKETKQFDVTKSYQHHSTDYHKKWWVILLEVLSLGIGYLVTEIIKLVADDKICDQLSTALNFDPRNGGLPINIGGVMGEVFDHLVLGSPQFYHDNFFIPLHINW